LKIQDSQLQKIRQLYKNIIESKRVQSDFDAKLAGETTASTDASATSGAGKEGPETNYTDLDHMVERRKYEFATRAVADAPDIRADRVADIEARIKAGTYKVEAETVAEALLGTGLFDDI